jgi:formate transporter
VQRFCFSPNFKTSAMPEVSLLSVIKNPVEAYNTCVDKGAELCGKPAIFLFHASFMAGCYIGFGGLLALVICGNIPEVSKNNPGFQSLLFAMLFPVNLIIIMLTGALLFTGASFTTVAAVIEGKAKPLGCVKVLFFSWWGNFLGSMIFALFTEWCNLVDGPTGVLALKMTIKKTSFSFGACFARGIGCNWLVCLAVYLSTMAQDLTGKYLAILLCISCFVAIGFEHIPANFYTLSVGYIYNRQFNEATADPSVGDIWGKNFVPCSLGNFVAGAFCMAVQYSFAYGRLSNLWKPKPVAAPKADVAPSQTPAMEDQIKLKISDDKASDKTESTQGHKHDQRIIDPQEIVLVTTAFRREVSHEGN